MTTTLIESVESHRPDQYLYLENVDWECYEMVLAASAEQRNLQITYDNGRMEIMSSLPRHERAKVLLGRMVGILAMERNIEVHALGSTTFRRQMLNKGLEPWKVSARWSSHPEWIGVLRRRVGFAHRWAKPTLPHIYPQAADYADTTFNVRDFFRGTSATRS